MPRWLNLLIQSLMLTGQIGNQLVDIVPVKYKFIIMLILGGIQGVVGVIANSYNPDGTSALTPYIPSGTIAKIG